MSSDWLENAGRTPPCRSYLSMFDLFVLFAFSLVPRSPLCRNARDTMTVNVQDSRKPTYGLTVSKGMRVDTTR